MLRSSLTNVGTTRTTASAENRRVALFYDRVATLYPLVDCFLAAGRRRLIHQINREPAGSLLEIGCGPGHYLRHYRHRVTAIDCSPGMAARCRLNNPDTPVHVMDGEQLEFPDANFDYVVLGHVLSVTDQPGRMLAEARRVVRPGGRVFVANHETPQNRWRCLDDVLMPVARKLCFRTVFRLARVPGVENFRPARQTGRGLFGLTNAYTLEK
jgi:phosphatidylethanolamine/phosphatidyl-N-methylethanolamine N-methyltransferase